MTEEDFIRIYKPKKNHLDPNASWDGYMFETFGAELEAVKAAPANCIWTLYDDMSISSGYHYVNRLGYFICEVPCTECINVDADDDFDRPDDEPED
jgi:hypothetical protein